MPRKPSKSANASHPAPMPEGLSRQLHEFRKRLWYARLTEAVMAGFFGLFCSFLLVFGLDRFAETPATLRLVILLAGFSLFVVFAPIWINRWVFGHRRENQLARLISKRFPKLGDRLLGAVELQDQIQDKETLSPQLRAAAMRTVAAEASRLDLEEALPAAKRHRKWSLVVASLLIASIAAMVSVPEAGMNALKRWLMPLSDTQRYTFTRLDLSAFNTPHHIPYGEAFSLTIPLASNTDKRPAMARARFGSGPWVKAPLVKGAYTFDFEGQRSQDVVRIEADDALRNLSIEPVVRPAVESMRATVTLPDYLQHSDSTTDLRSGFLTVVEGSQIQIDLLASRKLSSASAEVITLPGQLEQQPQPDENTDPSTTDAAPPSKETQPSSQKLALKPVGNRISTPAIDVGVKSLLIPIQWRDIHGLSADAPLKLRVESIPDRAPSTYIQGMNRQHVMLAEETIEFDVIAEDDFGLKACGITWQGTFTRPTGGEPAEADLTLQQGGPTESNLLETFSFSPANYAIQPQKLTMRAWAEDYKPERGRIYSEPFVIYILTRNEHAQMLKNQFDRAIGELEDIARKEQNLNDENLRIERKFGEKIQSEEAQGKLMEQQNAEAANMERMKELTKRMEELFKNSVRNEEVDKETLQQMSKAMQSMKELAGEDLPRVEQKLSEAQSKRNTEEKSKQDLKEAIDEQKKAIEKMQQALKDANDANENFEASTFVNRLKRASSEHEHIASAITDVINRIIGSRFADLDPVEQRLLKSTHAQQRQTAADIRWIQEDLAHYYTRTQRPEHKQLVDSMQSSNIDESLEKLSSQISANLSYTSVTHSKHWSKKLRDWAKQLEGDQGGAGGGGGGGGGGASAEDEDFEFMLKVMRMIQKEQDIRARTRGLEDMRRALQPKSKVTNP